MANYLFTSYLVFKLSIIFARIVSFFFFKIKFLIKTKDITSLDNIFINKRHINHNSETKKINLIMLFCEIEKYLYNYSDNYFFLTKKNKKKVIHNFLEIFNFKEYTYPYFFVIIKYLSILSKINKYYKNLSYLIFLILINRVFYYKKINTYSNKFEKKLIIYLKSTFLLKNFTVSKMSALQKEKKIINYINKYNDYISLKNAEIVTEHAVSNNNILKKIKKKISKVQLKTNLNSFYLGTSLYAFGHQINLIEILHRIKNFKFKIIISPFYVANSCLANYLLLRYPNQTIISHYKFLQTIIEKKFYTDFNLEEIDNSNSIYHLSYKEFKKTRKISSSIKTKLINLLFKKVNTNLLKFKEKYVLINLRNKNFKNYDKVLDTNDDRFSSPGFIDQIISYLNNNGYKVVLLNGQLKNLSSDLNFYDYSNSKYKNDYNDIFLLKNCNFILNFGLTASTAHPMMFSKYVLNLDYPFNRKPIFNNLAFYGIRPLYKNNKKINFLNYFSKDLYINHDFKILKDKGYKLGNLDKNETIEILKKFISIYKKKTKFKVKFFNKYPAKKKFYYPVNVLN